MLKYGCFLIQDRNSTSFVPVKSHSVLLYWRAIHVLCATKMLSDKSAHAQGLWGCFHRSSSNPAPFYTCWQPLFLQMQISLAWRKTNNNRYLHKNSTALHKPSVTLDPSLAEVVPFMCKNAWFRLLEKAITLLQRTGPACQVALLLDIPAYAKNVQNVLWKLEDR